MTTTNKPQIDLTFIKYQWSVIKHDTYNLQHFADLGFKRLSDNTDDVASWYSSGSAIMYVKHVINEEDGIYGLGFSSEEPEEYEQLDDPNGIEITIAGHEAMGDYITECFQPVTNMLSPSELINFYSIVYETTDLQKTLQFYLEQWHWDIIEENSEYTLITSNKGRTMLKFIKGKKNRIQTVYVGVKDIKKQMAKIMTTDFEPVKTGSNDIGNAKLPVGFNESILNNYNLSLGGRTQNYAIEFCIKNALPGVDFIFSQRYAYNSLSESNYEKFYNV